MTMSKREGFYGLPLDPPAPVGLRRFIGKAMVFGAWSVLTGLAAYTLIGLGILVM